MARTTALDRSQFGYFWSITTRWADNDVYAHVNNAIHYQFFDTAVNGWLLETGLLDFGGTDSVFLVVETGCTYFSEIAFPDRIDAGIRVTRLGSSSVTYEVGLFRNDALTASAQGHFVHVNVGRNDRKPRPISPSNRTILETLMVQTASS